MQKLFKKYFIHLFMRNTERKTETQAEGEAGSHREPDVGLDPRTPGSQPELKADAQPLSHPHIQINKILKRERERGLGIMTGDQLCDPYWPGQSPRAGAQGGWPYP